MTRLARITSGAIWLLVVGVVLFSVSQSVAQPAASASQGGVANEASFVVFLLSFSTVGALVASRRPRNPIGWLLLASALCYVIGGAGTSVGAPASDRITPLVVLEWAGQWSFGAGVGLAVAALLLFPDGHLASKRWRPALWIAVAGVAAFVLGQGFGSPVIGDGPAANPFVVRGPLGDVLAALQAAFGLVILGALLAVASTVARFARARGVEREQIKWLLYAAALVALGLLAQIPLSVALPPQDAVNASNAVVTATLAGLPIAIGVAVLRYRLYDIDVLINRTLVYGALTASLVLTYVVAVLATQTLLAPFTRGSEIGVAASTLLVVALFQPFRRRIQHAVDRRFYRSRYDAARTLDAFATRLRDEVDIDALRVDLLGVVDSTVRPVSASVWLRAERS